MSSKGYMKYGLVFLLSGWMFFLGILVGRGTAPVSFDTKAFQKKLREIAEQYAGKRSDSRPELVFYDALKKPSRQGESGTQALDEILPALDDGGSGKSAGDGAGKSSPREAPARPPEAVPAAVRETPSAVQAETAPPEGRYTLQVASFKDLSDALKLVARLEAKGHPAYRTLGTVGRDIWFRVRVGSFPSMEEARAAERRLKSEGINVLIIQKD
jgi:cell division protein FtsN